MNCQPQTITNINTFTARIDHLTELALDKQKWNIQSAYIEELIKNWTFLEEIPSDKRQGLFEKIITLGNALCSIEHKSLKIQELILKIHSTMDKSNLSGLTSNIMDLPTEIKINILESLPINNPRSLKLLLSLRILYPSVATPALAEYINMHKIPIIHLLEADLEEIHDLCPLLECADLRGLPLSDTELENFTRKCPHLNTLMVNSYYLTTLPSLFHFNEKLTHLICDNCSNLTILPSYPNLQIFSCKNTPLDNIPNS